MAKFREITTGITRTLNHEGAPAYKQKPKQELLFTVASSFIEDSFYENKDGRLDRIKNLVKDIVEDDPIYVAKLAYILRKEWHMRSSYHVLVGELAKNHKGDSLVKNLIASSVERPDDLMEITAYVGKPLPNSIKKGVAKAIGNFNEYSLSKYKGEGRSYSLVDLFNLTHPKPVKAKERLYSKVIDGELKIPDTWETKLSDGESHKDVWKELLKEDKLGYMALIRNIRNVIEKADKQTVSLALEQLVDKERVLKSKQLPFRFLTAYRELEGIASPYTSSFLDALENAMDISVENLPHFSGVSYITSDNSGSMTSPVSARSKVTLADIANTFLAIGNKLCDSSITTIFGDVTKAKMFSNRSGVLANVRTIQSGEVGHSTNAWTAIRFLNDRKQKVDRIILLSDMQCYDSSEGFGYSTLGTRAYGSVIDEVRTYRANVNPKVQVYSIDLHGYGTLQFPQSEPKTCLISGWSDKVFQLMELLEAKSDIVKYVEDYPCDEQLEGGSR